MSLDSLRPYSLNLNIDTTYFYQLARKTLSFMAGSMSKFVMQVVERHEWKLLGFLMLLSRHKLWCYHTVFGVTYFVYSHLIFF